jgi:hypothetical protein
MIEKVESYKTKDGSVFAKEEVEEVIRYKTEDGRTFSKEIDADNHLDSLEDKKKLIKTGERIKQLFKQELLIFANENDDYDGVDIENPDVEWDFWDAKCQGTSDKNNVDVDISDFEDYALLVKALLENFHLEKTIKIVKKTMTCNLVEETI